MRAGRMLEGARGPFGTGALQIESASVAWPYATCQIECIHGGLVKVCENIYA